MDAIIEINHLKKSFGTTNAVDDISFQVRRGELFAFLGINGAGKSTTINILVGVLKKDSGQILIEGTDIDQDGSNLDEIGIVFQSSLLDKNLNVYDNLRYRALLYGITKEEFARNLSYLAEALELGDIMKKPLDKLSGGQKRKVDIVRALLHKPKILILDEPTTGLDPKTRRQVWNLISTLISEERLTVMLTTHYMEEASQADYVVIIDKGSIVAEGTPFFLKEKYAHDYLKVYRHDERLRHLLDSQGIVYQERNRVLTLPFSNTKDAESFLSANSEMIQDFEIIKGTMDDVFLNVTGKELESL